MAGRMQALIDAKPQQGSDATDCWLVLTTATGCSSRPIGHARRPPMSPSAAISWKRKNLPRNHRALRQLILTGVAYNAFQGASPGENTRANIFLSQ